MANEVKFKLAIEGFEAVKDKLDKVEQKLGGVAGAIGKMGHIGAALYAIPTALNATVGSTIRAADAITTLNTQLRLATGSAAQASKAYSALFDIAQQGRVSFTELGTTFAAISRAGREMGVSQERLLVVTQSISQAMTIGGGSAASMNAALIQLGQGLSSGVLRGEELNSIMEQTPRLAKAIADGLGVPIGKLRELGAAGQLTGEQVISALERSGPQLAKEMESATLTVGQALTVMGNSAANFIGQVDQAVGLSAKVAQAMQDISQSMDGVSTSSAAVGFLTNDFRAAGEAMDAAKRRGSGFFGKFNQGMGMLIGRATAMQYLSRDFMTLDQAVADATATINRLDAQEQKFGKLSIFSMSERATAVRDLARANRELAASQPTATANSYANEDAKLAAHTAAWKARMADQAAFAKAGEAYLSTAQKNQKLLNDETEKNSVLLAKGSITAAQFNERINAVRASFEKKVSAGGLSEAAIGLATYNDLMAKDNGLAANFEEQAVSLSKAKLSTQQLTEAMGVLVNQQPFMLAATKTQAEANKEAAKADELAFKAMDDLRSASEKQITTAATTLGQIEFETRLLDLNTEARAIATMERELERQGIVKGTAAYDDYIVKLREAMAIKTGKEAGIKAADDLREAQQKAAEASGKYWEDALMRAFESGKGFFQSLWDTIKNTLKTQILKVTVQGVMGTLGLGASGAAIAGESGGGNLLGVAGNLKTMYDALSGGVGTAIASGFGKLAVSGFGQTLGLSTTAGVMGPATAAGAAPAMLTSTGSMASLAAQAAASAIAGYALYQGISGGYKINDTLDKVGKVASLFGPIYGAIGGIVNRAFGRKAPELTSAGTRGTFAGDGFEGTNYANYVAKGGLFRSNKYTATTSAIDPATLDAWSSAFIGVKSSVAGMAASLGLSTDKITSYTKYIDLAAGSTAEQLTAVFTGMADEMASASSFALGSLAKTGETSSATLSRLSTSLALANQWLGQFNDTLLATSVAAGDQASKLMDAFGGGERFEAAQSAYYQAMYTAAQRLADTTVNVAKGLALVGVAMPDTLAAYNKLRDAQDLMTESGRNAYTVMTLLGPEFAQVAEATTKTIADVFDALDKRLSSLRDTLASGRASVASARQSIKPDAVKNYDQILAGVQSSSTQLPSTTSLANAAQANALAQTNLSTAAANLKTATGNTAAITSAQQVLDSHRTTAMGALAAFKALGTQYGVQSYSSAGGQAYAYNASTDKFANWAYNSGTTTANNDAYNLAVRGGTYGVNNAGAAGSPVNTLTSANTNLAAAGQVLTAAKTTYNQAVATAQAKHTTATAAATAAANNVTTQTSNYTAAVTAWVAASTLTTAALGALKDQTMAYYEQQKALADLMHASATGLRSAVKEARQNTLSDTQSLADGLASYARNYSLALSTSGAAKVGYGDKMAGALPQLSQALEGVSATRADYAVAVARLASQSETIASQLEATAPASYEAQALTLLGAIDAKLLTLDTNAATVKDALIAAVDNGAIRTASGLSNLIKAVQGNTSTSLQTFATGGVFTNSVVAAPTTFAMGQMGEAGPEAIMPLTRGPGGALGVKNYNTGAQATDTAAQRELLSEVKRLNARMEDLNREMQQLRRENNIGNSQIADSTDRSARIQERWSAIGLPATEAA